MKRLENVRRVVAQLEQALDKNAGLLKSSLKGIQQYAGDVTLNHDPANHTLILSEDEENRQIG